MVATAGLALCVFAGHPALGQMTANERKAVVGDAPADPGPLATDLSGALKPIDIQAAMRKVADWQNARIVDSPSQDWTFATLYIGMLSASDTLGDPRYRNSVASVADYYHWTLGPRKTHADDQAIGQAYLWMYRQTPDPQRIQPLRAQFDEIMQAPDDPAKPVWWWCDALFMTPPVWSGLAEATGDPKYLAYMDHEWRVTSDLLWDPHEQLFFRDSSYFDKREKNGRKVFWSRGNGWVMGGIARVLDYMPKNYAARPKYIAQFREMAAAVMKVQGEDGLWRSGLLDSQAYPLPEASGSAFIAYALAWGVNQGILDRTAYAPAARKAWAGLLTHVYADGRLGCIQPVGAAPGQFKATSSFVYGVGAFLLAGSQMDRLHF
jgi:rhamnogalacturonyl hydrolase YesR